MTLKMLLLCLVAILMLSAVNTPAKTHATSETDWWPMFHHDPAHTGYSTSTAPNTNNTLWSYKTVSAVYSSPAVVDGKVYIGSSDGYIYCLDADTGSKIWSYKTGDYVPSSPAVASGKVYVGSEDGYIYCLDADTGSEIWSYKTEGWVWSSPAIADGKVYVGSHSDGYIYCLNADTGFKIWSYKPKACVFSSPAVVDGKVYVGSDDSNIYCLDADTGSMIWSYKTGDYVGWSSPAVVDGKVYIGSYDFNIYCLDADTGFKIWSYMTEQGVQSSPAVVDGKVYVGSTDGYVYAFETTTGGFAIKVQPGGSISYSYAATSETVSGGSTEVIYVPAGTSILLSAQPSSFLYQFNGWNGAITSSNGQVSLNVNPPMNIEAAFGYNYTNIGLIAGIAIVAVLAGSFLALRRRRQYTVNSTFSSDNPISIS
jgi:outer membrane protein assembly factor BamB